jgi:hypothetical protein
MIQKRWAQAEGIFDGDDFGNNFSRLRQIRDNKAMAMFNSGNIPSE